jgi:DNA modification methylase
MDSGARRIRRGDVWQLGTHRLLCGDATDAGDVARILEGQTPHLMVTDPPYGVRYDPAWRVGKVGRGSKVAGRPFAGDTQADWSPAWKLFPGDVAYVWHAGKMGHIVARSLRMAGFDVRSQIIWAKPYFAISRGHYHWQHEPCFYAVRQGATGHWNGDRKQSTLWRITGQTTGIMRDRKETYTGHGAQKPVEAMARPMRNNSQAGDLVYDPFLGSGTSVMAAEREGRVCVGLEIEPVCCDMILRRWERETGTPAKRG